ncbi:MAG: hypothetical protein AAGD38_19480 [Acidobacteriota bacterium]
MTNQEAIEHLPWLLNGTIEPNLRDQVVDAIRRSAEVREALIETVFAFDIAGQLPRVEDVLDAALSDDGGRRLEHMIQTFPMSAEEAELVRSSQELMIADEHSVPVLASIKRETTRWRVATFAAMAVAAVGMVGMLYSMGLGGTQVVDGPSSEQVAAAVVNVRSFVIHAGDDSTTRGVQDPVEVVELAPTDQRVKLDFTPDEEIVPDDDPRRFSLIMLRAGESAPLVELSGFEIDDMAFSMTVSTKLLTPGAYVVEAYEDDAWRDSGREAARIGTFRFTVARI